MTDEPVPLPAADGEIDHAIEKAFAQNANRTMPGSGAPHRAETPGANDPPSTKKETRLEAAGREVRGPITAVYGVAGTL